MAILWMNLGIVYFFSLCARFFAKPINSGPFANHDFVQPNRLMVLVVTATLVAISGLRKNIGDTVFYIQSYRNNSFALEDVLSGKDVGFGFLQMVLKQISDDPQVLLFTCALITNGLIVMVLYKYTRLFELSIFVYITAGMYLVSMNGMRQYLAAAIIFAATKYIFDGSWKKYSLIIFLASFIHGSALILIPMYFIVRRKAWTFTTLMILMFAVLLAMGYSQISDILFAAIEDTQYSEYKNFSEGGANIIRVIVYAVPIILAFMGRHKLREIFPNSDYIVNMAILGLVFMVISTQNWIFARFSIYFGLYNLILISWIVKTFVRKEQILVYYAIILFYLVYCFYEQAISLNVIYRSDYFQL